MRLTKVGAPVTSSDGNDGNLSNDDGGANGSGDFLGCLDTETNVSVGVSNDHDSLETCALTGTGLLLNWLDLRDQISDRFQCAAIVRYKPS